HGFAPIVIVLNNQGYGTERFLHPGKWEYNEIHSWAYHQLPAVLGGGTGYEIFTEGELDTALQSAWDDTSGFSLLHVHTSVDDASRTLRRLADRMGQRVRGVVED
ncbi:MAG TPA: preprotein translocase subunit Tim44, partial [Planctomycetaceae bacterium]|nr:preprotein translocase subunit Tim44 [Planctomycetaceae bacterium]